MAKITKQEPEPAEAASQAQGEDLVDIEGALALLKTTRPTFYRWLKTGKLKGMKVGRQWRFYKKDIERFLKGEEPRIESSADMVPFLNQLRAFEETRSGKAKEPYTEGNVVTALNVLLMTALGNQATDIHLTPMVQPGSPEGKAVTSIRIDGVLQRVAVTDLRLHKPLVERIKLMSHLELNERRLPQDGRIELIVGGRPYDLRISALPTVFGESITIRVMPPISYDFSLDRLEYAPSVRKRLEAFLARPWGLAVFTGPAGSGRTTSLYSALTHLAGPSRKIVSVENPVEVLLPHVLQTPIRPDLGLSFATLTRSVLRSAPNVVAIGHIPDAETLELAFEAALTGHLVFTTMHTDDAANALIRMVQLGTNPVLASDATKLVIAQRLIRKLCPACSVPGEPAAHERTHAEKVAHQGGLAWDILGGKFRAAKGCKECARTGYKGRTLIAEALEVTPEITGALRRKASAEELRSIAIGQGMVGFGAQGVRMAAEGLTTLDEVLRHVPPPPVK
ncbi:MAG: Flp pilus assembly complex ATPase component TadA [Planctomycetota bacterium]|nr:Flp pilus assembly complex ATPase component TadA [Planctomycetota bacterium]